MTDRRVRSNDLQLKLMLREAQRVMDAGVADRIVRRWPGGGCVAFVKDLQGTALWVGHFATAVDAWDLIRRDRDEVPPCDDCGLTEAEGHDLTIEH